MDRARQAVDAHTGMSDAADEVSDSVDAGAASSGGGSPRVMTADAPVAAAPTRVDPTPEFMTWVSDARISGVREGDRPRAFINGILVQKGDVIDSQLGVVFEGVDARRNLLIFRDRTGAVVGKKY